MTFLWNDLFCIYESAENIWLTPVIVLRCLFSSIFSSIWISVCWICRVQVQKENSLHVTIVRNNEILCNITMYHDDYENLDRPCVFYVIRFIIKHIPAINFISTNIDHEFLRCELWLLHWSIFLNSIIQNILVNLFWLSTNLLHLLFQLCSKNVQIQIYEDINKINMKGHGGHMHCKFYVLM